VTNSSTNKFGQYHRHNTLLKQFHFNTNLVYLQHELTCNSAMKRKKQFEYLRNCSKRKLGTKDRALYLAVEIWLLQYRVGCGRFTKMIRCSVTISSATSVTTEFVSTSSSANRRDVKHEHFQYQLTLRLFNLSACVSQYNR
jgi:hypothetical protein